MSIQKARGYRVVDTRMGDTIQAVAQRELGDPSRWPELVSYNRLAPPYIVDHLSGLEVTGAEGRIILAGQRIRIPANVAPSAVADPDDIFGTDLSLPEGLLQVDADGDLLLVRDVPNLAQAIRHRLGTHEGELLWHKEYGNPLFDLPGDKGDPLILFLAGKLSQRTIQYDPRISRAENVTADLQGDAITVEATAVAIDGRSLPVGSE